MNVKLLREVRDYIVKYPEKYNQSNWCGSACCVAGTAAFLSGKISVRKVRTNHSSSEFGGSISRIAREALGLSRGQAARLFEPCWGSLPRRYQVNQSMPPEERAAIAYDRINRFIETKGAE